MTKSAAIRSIKSSVTSAAHELQRAGLRRTSHALRVVGGATASIGHHTAGWNGELGGMVRGAPLSGHKRRKRRKSGSSPKRRKTHHHKKSLKRARVVVAGTLVARTPAMRHAARHGRKRKAKRSGKQRTAKQRAATKKMLAANRARRR